MTFLTILIWIAWADLIISWMIRLFPFVVLAVMLIVTILLNLRWNPLD